MVLEYVYFFIKKIKTEKIEKQKKYKKKGKNRKIEKNCILYLYFKIIKK